MSGKSKNISAKSNSGMYNEDCVPFDSVEEVWFWFIAAQQARNEGAKYIAGAGLIKRPCEPVDILKVMDGLYRKRRLVRDHLLVLRHYGRRHMAPDPRRTKEKRAHFLWHEAFDRMRPVLERKGIVAKQSWLAAYAHNDGAAMPSLFPEGYGVAAE